MQPGGAVKQRVRAQIKRLHTTQNAQRQRGRGAVRRFELQTQRQAVITQARDPTQRCGNVLKRRFVQRDETVMQRRLLKQRGQPLRVMFRLQPEGIVPVLLALPETGDQQQLRRP